MQSFEQFCGQLSFTQEQKDSVAFLYAPISYSLSAALPAVVDEEQIESKFMTFYSAIEEKVLITD
jgi:hypothetical protein